VKWNINIGELVKFNWIYNYCKLNERVAIYLGEDVILREDGVKVENHKVYLLGDTQVTTIDENLMYSLSKYNGK